MLIGTIDDDLLSHLRGIVKGMVRPRDPNVSSAIGAVDVLGSLASMMICVRDVDAFICSHIGVHDDSHMQHQWSQLIYLGPWDGNPNVRHQLHLIPDHVGYEAIEEWIPTRRIPDELFKRRSAITMQPGQIINLDNLCPHWMTIQEGELEIGGPFPESEVDVLDRHDALVAAFVSFGCDAPRSPGKLNDIARSLMPKKKIG